MSRELLEILARSSLKFKSINIKNDPYGPLSIDMICDTIVLMKAKRNIADILLGIVDDNIHFSFLETSSSVLLIEMNRPEI
ncbi:hypothetical protein GCM10007940_41670 [Portibacter lacus]|uniref:Uncharacterized protein n=1 Tax=Portibacter lacus TaxID=1099794 RepID=A0AA37SVI8_9BACT|nr:hypothetical protein GCM10007940_41670 [Portibacter lacus]